LICGNLERCVELLITERIGPRSAPQVASFLKSFFKSGRNYDCDEICQLLFKFDAGWGREFETYMKSHDSVKDGVASCYAVRNSVAHGGGQSLGPRALRQYFNATLDLVAELDAVLQRN
jgi:hypothetical protein